MQYKQVQCEFRGGKASKFCHVYKYIHTHSSHSCVKKIPPLKQQVILEELPLGELPITYISI